MRSIRWSIALVAFFLIFSGTAALRADDKGDEPRALIHAVNPMNVHVGDQAVATGERLGKKFIAALYLTNGKEDFYCDIVKQDDTTLTFKVPEAVNGRYRLMIQTAGVEPRLVEQPVRIVLE